MFNSIIPINNNNTVKSVKSEQCEGKTKRGLQCKRQTKNIDRRCYQHPVLPHITCTSTQKFTLTPTQKFTFTPNKKITFTPNSKKKPVFVKVVSSNKAGSSNDRKIEYEDCIICTDPLDKDRASLDDMNCTHTQFHVKCLRKCMNSKCPICRKIHKIDSKGGKATNHLPDIPPELVDDDDNDVNNEIPELIDVINVQFIEFLMTSIAELTSHTNDQIYILSIGNFYRLSSDNIILIECLAGILSNRDDIQFNTPDDHHIFIIT